MSIIRREAALLLMGDLAIFIVSLGVAVFIRNQFRLDPSQYGITFIRHLRAFGPLLLLWVFVFYIAGLYGKHTLVFRKKLASLLALSQLSNIVIAAVFFYITKYFLLTPKTVLVLYLGVSSALLWLWRAHIIPVLGFRRKQKALLVGSGDEMRELREEINGSSRYALSFFHEIDLGAVETISFDDIRRHVRREMTIVADLSDTKLDPILPQLYALIFDGVRFIDLHTLYEEIFDRAPLSLLRHRWFLAHAPGTLHPIYDAIKRALDIIAAVIIGIPSLLLALFAWLAIKLDDGGPALIRQERIGQNGKPIHLYKFRSMTTNDEGKWLATEDRRVTRAGYWLRKSRIDELPQLWNVIRGDISMIGPRPDIRGLGDMLIEKIPYYTIRTIIKPGLSGWAQIKQDVPPQSLEETKLRLAHDLYYIKNRSLALDLEIALKTIKTLLSRSGM